MTTIESGRHLSNTLVRGQHSQNTDNIIL